jgi:hypothetical protein
LFIANSPLLLTTNRVFKPNSKFGNDDGEPYWNLNKF